MRNYTFYIKSGGPGWSRPGATNFDVVTQTLQEQTEGLGYLVWLLLQHHPCVVDLHPGGLGRVDFHVESYGGVKVRTPVPY